MKLIPLISFIFLTSTYSFLGQTTINLTPVKDTSIYSEFLNNSNALGELFSGVTRTNNIRRALIKFNLSSIPAGASINSVTLTLAVTDVAPGAGTQNYKIYKLTKDWGEGTSTGTGIGGSATSTDATWSYSMFPSTNWASSGGDYSGTTLASLNISAIGNYTFLSTSNFVSAAQSWLDTPATNFGLILIGDESGTQNARIFGSKDSTSPAPILSVNYTAPLGLEDIVMDNFTIFPNPSGSDIKLKVPKSLNNATVSIFNILGKEILTFPSSYESINVSSWSNGLYLIKVSSQDGTLTKRFVKN